MSVQNSIADEIQPAVLTRLASHAKRMGKTVNTLLQEMLDDRETVTPQTRRSSVAAQTADEWTRELRAWATRHPIYTAMAEDS